MLLLLLADVPYMLYLKSIAWTNRPHAKARNYETHLMQQHCYQVTNHPGSRGGGGGGGVGGVGRREYSHARPKAPKFLTVAIGTMVVPIRILIHTIVVPIRTLIRTTAIISALSSYPSWWSMCNWCLFNWFHFILWYLLDFATNMC